MLQPSHRGIYEYLWSEHKYSIIAISLKTFHGMAERLGKRPQILNWLRRLAVLAESERPENYNALLNAYLHIKPGLTREQRHEIIELLLSDEQGATELIYQHALNLAEKSLYGCRLFFKSNKALYKFWDAQDKPGLWLCFGPFQQHLTSTQVFSRLAHVAAIKSGDLAERLRTLQNGISAKEFATWPEALCLQLKKNNLVAEPGISVILHPRAQMLTRESSIAPLQVDKYAAAALVLEKLWDNAEYPDDVVAQLPQYDEYMSACNADFMPEIAWPGDFCGEEAWDFIAGLFWQQKCAEAGLPAIDEDSSASVGVESADEEVDSEEGEHGHDEPDY